MNLRRYRFRGARAEGEGRTLDEAIESLSDFWDSRPSLVVHSWGVLQLSITIGNTEAVFEVTDPSMLDELEAGDTAGFIDWLAKGMGISSEDAEELLDRSSRVIAAVEKIRPPDQTLSWSEEPGMAAEDVLPDAALSWVGEVEKALDQEERRRPNQRRSRKARRLLVSVVESSMDRGLSDAEISASTGVPRSTVRDTRMRIERRAQKHPAFLAREPGDRLTDEQKRVIFDTLDKTSGNAAETARQLGVPARTVRGLRNRTTDARKDTTRTHRGNTSISHRSSTYTADDKAAVFDGVDSGLSASEAGRQAGVPARTARRWVSRRKE